MWETRLARIYGSQTICIYSYVLIVFLYRIDVLEMVKLSQIVSYTLVPPHLQVSSAMFTSQAIHWPLLLVQLLKIRTRLLFPMFVSS